MNKKSTSILLHLSLIPHIGPAIILKIFRKISSDLNVDFTDIVVNSIVEKLEELYLYDLYDFRVFFGFSDRISSALFNGLKDRYVLEEELCIAEKHKIEIFSFLDPDYPPLLKQIYLPPIVIYCRGSLGVDKKSTNLAIVGSRNSNFYAKNVIDYLVPALSENNFTIVSGGAVGADSIAHEAALNCGAKTISVIGSGLLNLYPKINFDLFEKIVDFGGALISSFPLKRRPERGNFPARNRIISGISHGSLVVQAAKRSGALITAQFALDQGRNLFAVPGPIDDDLSFGCHELIKNGAKIVASPEDILEEFEIFNSLTAQNRKSVNFILEDLSTNDEKNNIILQFLRKPLSIDYLSEKTGLTIHELTEKLFDMQLGGVVKQNFAGKWQRI